jgi:hypothetical protein
MSDGRERAVRVPERRNQRARSISWARTSTTSLTSLGSDCEASWYAFGPAVAGFPDDTAPGVFAVVDLERPYEKYSKILAILGTRDKR